MNDVIIIGSGPAGLTSAIYTGRAGLKTIVFAGNEIGGQLTKTTLVENYPGFKDGVFGPDLMQNMIEQAKKFGAEIIFESIDRVDFKGNEKHVYVGDKQYSAKSIIIATGASNRMLNIPGEKEYFAKGVSTCATCDGAFFRNKIIAVVGGGDSALEEASFLTKFASKVYVIHRRDEFRASEIMEKRVRENEKIELVLNGEVKEVIGDGNNVTSIKVLNNKENTYSTLNIEGLFIAIGHIPNTQIFKDEINLDEEGFIIVHKQTQTNIEGVFVAGDVKDKLYRQAITAAASGCKAALDCEKYLNS